MSTSKIDNPKTKSAMEYIARLIDGADYSSTAVGGPDPHGFCIKQMNQDYALAIWGGKAVVIKQQECGPLDDRFRVMSFEAMNSWFANRLTEVRAPDGRRKSATWAKAWHQHPDRRQYEGVQFYPNPDGAAATPNYLNLWRGFSVTPSKDGSWKRFEDHLRVNVCQDNPRLYQYLLGWMAHIVQRPRERTGIALVLRGRKGTGKTKVGEVLGSLFAPHYYPVDDARYLTGQFNAHMASCLLLQADEAMWAGDKAAEGKLKGLITSRINMIESKGMDSVRMENYVRVIMTSNEGWVVPATGDERRFFVLDVGTLAQQNNTYFSELDKELDDGGRSRLLHDLLMFDLSKINIWEAPKTNALLDQKLRSLDSIEDFWFGRLLAGEPWSTVITTDQLYGDYVQSAMRTGIGRRLSVAQFGKRMNALVPELRRSRPNVEISPGVFDRARCYEFPSLPDCRNVFEQQMGQSIDWSST